MVRPRLVEEGKPSRNAASNEEEQQQLLDELLAEELARHPQEQHYGHGSHRHRRHSHPSSASIDSRNISGSSLLRAAGGKLASAGGSARARVDVAICGDHSAKQHQHLHHAKAPQSIKAQPSSYDRYHHHPHGQVHTHAVEYTIGGQSDQQQSTATPMDHSPEIQPIHPPALHATQFQIGPPAVMSASQSYPSAVAPSILPQPPTLHTTQFQNGYPTMNTQPLIAAPIVPLQQSAEPTIASATAATTTAAAPTTTTTTTATPSIHRTSYEIGADERATVRMEGVEDHSVKAPLLVLDGANIAYAYGSALQGTSLMGASHPIPDARGIRTVVNYFSRANLRVLAVLPASWFRAKPRDVSISQNALMETDHLEAIEVLQKAGILVSAPPTDDDDAYVLSIAQRENVRAAQRGHGPAYVVSNDLFRDAQDRDDSGKLKEWLTKGISEEFGPGRISYAFCDFGAVDSYGERELDVVPNPRHPLVGWIESFVHNL